jgi:glutaredoxin
LGISVDHIPCLIAWADSLEGISFPLVSDFWPHGAIAEKYGVLRSDGRSERAIFIIDKEGVIQYIDIHDIDDQPSNEVLFAELARINPDASKKIVESKQETEQLPQDGVVLYCNKWCPDCRRAREWFTKYQIDFVEVDVITNARAAKQVREWADGDLVTPTINVDGTVVINWDRERMAELLLSD